MKWLPTLLSLASMIVTPLAPAIQTGISAHPTLAIVLAGIFGIVAHIMPSPVSQP